MCIRDSPLIISNDMSNQPVDGSESRFFVREGGIGAEIFPETTYPVGSLILGLDYEANSVSAAASVDNSSTVTGGLHVQYNFGGRLSQTNMASGDGGNDGGKPFTYNNATGEVEATKFKGDGSALTNLPFPSTNQIGDSGSSNGDIGTGGDIIYTGSGTTVAAVSYTHLTLPTIRLV